MPSGASYTDIPEFYAAVAVGTALPNVPYTSLADLHLKSSDENLIRKALELKGYDPDTVGYIVFDEDPTGGGTGGGGGSPFEEFCGCQVYKNQRKPGGCIRVWDTEKEDHLGVEKVKVIMKDTWFTEDETYTDEDGCWKISNSYGGHAWMWVKWKNSTVKIRGIRRNAQAVYQWAQAIKDYVGKISGPRFNDIKVEYNIWTTRGTSDHLYWAASTVNNAVHDFGRYAGSDGISPPPSRLDIFAGQKETYGYALMSGQYVLGAALAAALLVTAFFAGPWSILIVAIGYAATVAYLPDVFVGINHKNSDRVKETTFHEVAHASHYTSVGSDYWEDLMWAEIWAGGHGSASSQNADLIALCESWAFHLGFEYTDRFYGSDNSEVRFGDWGVLLESTRNEYLDHVPIGLYNDLSDSQTEPVVCYDLDGQASGVIDDVVSGFSISNMFWILTPAIKSPSDFIDNVKIGQSGQVQLDIDDLFLSY